MCDRCEQYSEGYARTLPWPPVRTGAFYGIRDFLGRENLDGHESAQMRVAGLVHHAHTAASQGFDNLVMQDGASHHVATRIFDMCESNCIAGASQLDPR